MTKKADAGAARPIAERWRLACGRECCFVMPDMLAFAAGDIDLPSITQADVYELLYGANGPSIGDVQIVNDNRRRTRGLYALFSLVAIDPATERPILCLDDEERQLGQISPRQIAWGDLSGAYSFFRFGPSILASAPQDTGSAPGEGLARAGDDVPPVAE